MMMDFFTWATGYLTVAIGGSAVSALLCLAYYLALPKPLPGLPYNRDASKRLFGDLWAMRKAKYRRQWLWSQPREHGSLVAQVFLSPFGRPSVVVTDYHEVVDICSRRQREFDRGTTAKDIVGFTAPNFHFTMESRDPRFASQRAIIRDLMTPSFLDEISAPRVYERVATLVDLWDIKSRMAGEKPFPAHNDISLATLDVICSVAFSLEDEKSSLRSEINQIKSLDSNQFQTSDDYVEFPRGPRDPEMEAVLDIQVMLSIAISSPFPRLAQMLALLRPTHARAQWNRRALLRRQTDRGLKRLSQSGLSSCQSALDRLLWREVTGARKSGRTSNMYSPVIRDEIFGYLLAGHESTTTVSSWWIKYIARHQPVQDRLRSDLRQAHASAVREGRWPTKDEICTASIPYLDAVIEETLRYASVSSLTMRTTTCDTQILGHAIPKGTDVILHLGGPSVTEPALPRSGALRPRDKEGIPYWGEDVEQFKPERWLKRATDPATRETRETFDANAGPNLAFSAGPRQCFGKRLAYMELKMLVTLLLWNFEFGAVSESLDGDEMVEMLINKPRNCYASLKRL